MKQRCGNCQHFNGKTNKNGKRTGRGVGKCAYPEIKWPSIPICQSVELRRIYVWPDTDAEECDVWEKYRNWEVSS